MKFVIVGAGGVGGYYAAKLKHAGNSVQVIARGEHLEKIIEKGITINSDIASFTEFVDRASDDPADLDQPDAVIVAVKAFQVNSVLESIKSLVGRNTVVLTIQNGVEAYQELVRKFPDNAVCGLTRLISYIEKPGVIKHIGPEAALSFGRINGESDVLVEKVKEEFTKTGINCSISDNIEKAIWEKFMIMATMGGVGSITQAPVGALLSLKETRELIDQSLDEVQSVASASGVKLDQESRKKVWDFFKSLPYEASSSTQRDVAAGKPSEIGYLSGSVAVIGASKNVNVPLHRFIYTSLMPRELNVRGKLKF